MSRILIDCTHIDFRRQPTGIPRVVLKYIEEGYLWAAATGNEVIPVVPTSAGLFLCRPVPGASPPQALTRLAALSIEFEKRAPAHASSRDGSPTPDGDEPPHLVELRSGDVLFSPAYWHDNDPRYYIDAKKAGAKVVILVHDILPIAYKQYYRSPWRYSFAAAVLQSFSYADLLLCVSDTTRLAIESFAGRRRCKLPAIEVAYNGFQDLVSPSTIKRMRQGLLTPHTNGATALKALLGDGPLLMVGSIEPKKGHIPVIRTLEAMWAAGYRRDLVIVGRVGWMEGEIVDYIEQSPYRGSKLFWLSDLDDHDLAYAYVRSHALVFASIAEGFGIPMIEASRAGKPVVVLDTAIAREVLGDTGHYFSDAGELVGWLMALEDKTHWQAACDKAAAFQWVTWDECVPRLFEQLVEADIYETAAC